MAGDANIPHVEGIEGLEPIGQGGFATVYRGRQPAFRRDVAVKVLQHSSLDSDDRRRFERECQAMGALSAHPGIVTLYDAGFTADGRPYLVMPFFADGTLHDRLARGPMTWQEVTVIGIELAGALETAHRAGVIHRDIKPANVLRSHYGHQLSDFGIARLQGGHETRSGVITASIAHAPPEILDGHSPTERADVYSLGSTLYEALCGRSAFSRTGDESLLSLVRRVMAEPAPDLRESGVPSPIAHAVVGAMAKDPADRYQSAMEFGRALQEAQAELGANISDLMVVGDDGERVATSITTKAKPPPDTPPSDTPPSDTPPPEVISATVSTPRAPEPSGPTVAAPGAPPEQAPRPPAPAYGGPAQVPAPGGTAPGGQPPSHRPTQKSPARWLVPLVALGIVVVALAAFALRPKGDPETASSTVPDSVPTSADTTDTGSAVVEPTTGPTEQTTIPPEPTTIPPQIAAGPAEAVVAATFEFAPTAGVDGYTLTAIDGISYDAARGRLLAAKEPAPQAVSDGDPSLADPAIFFIPLDVAGATGADSTVDLAAGSAAPLLNSVGVPFGLELDIEGMAVLDDGSFFVVSEGSGEQGSVGAPAVNRFDATGRLQSTLVLPEWYLDDGNGTRGLTPNRGLHGIDLRPGYTDQIVIAIEGPLIQDQDPTQNVEPKTARLIAYDVATGEPTVEWGYPLDTISPAVAAAVPEALSSIVDIASIGDGSLAVLEATRNAENTLVYSLYRVVLGDGNPPSADRPPALEKSPITVTGADGASLIQRYSSVSVGPLLPDGMPSLVLANDNAFADEPTRIMILGIDTAN